MGTIDSVFHHSTTEQDFTAAGEVDIRKLVETAPGADSTSITAHPSAAGTTLITIDPYTNRSTTGDIRADAGWAINRAGADGMDSTATAKRVIAAGTWTFNMFAAIGAPAALGSLTLGFVARVYRVSSTGARSLLFTSGNSTTLVATVGGVSGALVATASPAEIVLEADETIHVGYLTAMTQVAGTLGLTVPGTATWTVGEAAENVTVPGLGVRTRYPRSLSDVGGAADVLTRVVTHPRSLADVGGAADSLARLFTGVRALADVAGATDSLTRAASFPRALADVGGATDSLARILLAVRALADVGGAADALVRLFTGSRSLADVGGATDSLTRLFTGQRSLADLAGASDAMTRLYTGQRSLADAAGATDSLARGFTGARSLADVGGATDSVARLFTGARSLSDLAGASDAMTRLFTATRPLADAAGATDVLTRLLVGSRSLDDTAGAVDSLARLLIYARALSDGEGGTVVIEVHPIFALFD